MKKYFSILLLFIVVNAFSQSESKADKLRSEGDLKGAIVEFAKLYKKNPKNKSNVYNYACALSLDEQIDSAFHYLKIAIAKDSSVSVLNDPDFYNLTKDERWSSIEDEVVERVEGRFGKYKNIELSKELWKMKIYDQAFYYHLDIADKNPEQNPLVINAIWEVKQLLNEKNLERIIEIIEKDGWPKKSVIKGNAASTVFLIIQHSDPETQRKYLPIMTKAANEGEAKWSSLALLIDRVNLGEDKKQIYGSQISRKEDGSYFVKNLEEPEYVNQRRNEIGLGKIQDYVKRWDINWTIKQKIKKK